ncbi:MAG: hypothetical protein BWY81_01050 [Firmicutes bacterium ADurb.Bin467]|nr:MAG: hypothetical protein BWY81_01050 [Firmicutes bacterium ADurb.Bin467]
MKFSGSFARFRSAAAASTTSIVCRNTSPSGWYFGFCPTPIKAATSGKNSERCPHFSRISKNTDGLSDFRSAFESSSNTRSRERFETSIFAHSATVSSAIVAFSLAANCAARNTRSASS